MTVGSGGHVDEELERRETKLGADRLLEINANGRPLLLQESAHRVHADAASRDLRYLGGGGQA